MLMTETYSKGALASAATTSSAGNALDTDSDGYAERLRLKIQPNPPKFPFRDHPFDLTVYMVDPSDHLKSGINVPLNVELYSADKMVPIEKQILHIDPSTKPVVQGDGICKLRLRISECSMAMGNRKFVIHISAAKSAGADLNVAPAVTTEMTVIQHRLVIQEKLPDLWYKDEGGRDKCMSLPIFLVNEKNERVQNRQVPLRVTLLYESEHPVLKQDILKMSPDCQRMIDNTGCANLKLRIEDVSKNHQGQAFRLKVEADTAQSPMNFDVAYDLSSTISVRSKRNKRRPLKNPAMSITHHIIAGASNPASATSSPSSNPDAEANLNSLNGFPTDEREAKRMRLTPSVGQPGGPKATTLTGSMESILSWTGAVVNGLHQLEWQTVGYESKSDGTADPERPIYRCPACWRYKDVMTYDTAQHDTKCLIANLLLAYATDTMGHLDYVLKSIEQFPAILAAHKNAKSMGETPGSNGPSLVSPQNLGLPEPSTPQHMSAMMMSQAMPATSSAGHFAMTSAIPTSSAPPPLTRGLTEMMNGMETPVLMRANSGGLSEFMRSLEDQDNSESSQMYFQNMANQSHGPNSQVAEAIEMQVFYVLARMITLNATNAIGFPAFDASMNLLGFYQEVRESSTTEVVFVPVSDIPAITQVEIVQTQRLLRTELKENSSAVHTLARCNNDLVKLKEDVILFHWNAKDRAAPTW